MTSQSAAKLIDLIAATSGAKAKKEVLAKYPALKTVFKYALDPYITFGVTDPAQPGRGTETFKDLEVGKLFKALSSRLLTGTAAINTCAETQHRLDPDSARLFGMILNKKLRCGMGAKTVNQVWPGLIPTHDIMLAKPYEAHRVTFPCVVEPKIDGIRATYIDGKLYSRKGLEIVGVDHILQQLKANTEHEEWDGELTIPGVSFQVGSGMIRSNDETPTAVFTIFASRNSDIESAVLQDTPNVGLIKAFMAHTDEEIMEHYHRLRDEGFEGVVVKPIHCPYEPKRSFKWMKLKPMEDGEFEIIGTYEGEGKYKGMLGGLIVDFNGQPNEVGTGFTDAQRYEFWVDTSIMGKLAHVEYMEPTDDGNMRHSRFKDIRWDK